MAFCKTGGGTHNNNYLVQCLYTVCQPLVALHIKINLYLVGLFLYAQKLQIIRVLHSVADPDPNFSNQDPGSKKIPDPGSAS